MVHEENWKLLAAGVINQAVSDYEHARKIIDNEKKYNRDKVNKAYCLRDNVEEFFHGEWFKTLTSRVDGPAMFKKIKENYEKTGKCRMEEIEE